MSARNTQSDTSRVIVKNPLLSAVAGSIDDFVNNSILLPAAEIPVTTVVPPSQSNESRELHETRDAKRSVIYGTEPPAVLESDKFSEISLDQTVDVDLTTAQAPQEYNPLQNLDTFLPVTSDQQQQQDQQQQSRDETLFNPLAQATAIKESLSQLPGVLPGVASSVFSSFSNILKGRASPGKTESFAPPNTSYSTQLPENQEIGSATQYNPYFYDQSVQQHQQQPPEVPPVVSFYSPTDPNLARPEASLSPQSADSQSNNLYRLKERKKLYAPIPGLNANNANLVPPNPSISPAVSQQPSVASNQSNSFSLSSFFSGTPHLDKPKLPEPAPILNQEPQPIPFYPPSQQIEPSAPPAATQFFNPNQFSAADSQITQSANESAFVSNPPISASPSPTVPSFNQQQQLQPPPLATSNVFNLNPFQRQQTPHQPPSSSVPPSQIFTPSLQEIPDQPQSHSQFAKPVDTFVAPPPPQTQFFNPNQFAAVDSQSSHENLQSNQSPFNVNVPPSQESSSLNQQPPPPAATQFYNPNQFTAPESAKTPETIDALQAIQQTVPVSTFALNPFQKSTNPPPASASASTSPALAEQTAVRDTYLPPSAAPPSGQTLSYRLKGKPLYRKPVSTTPFPNQSINQLPTQLFNPTSVPSTVSDPNLQIFSPFDQTQTFSQNIHQTQTSTEPVPTAQPSPPQSIAPPPVSIFNPLNPTQQEQDNNNQAHPPTIPSPVVQSQPIFQPPPPTVPHPEQIQSVPSFNAEVNTTAIINQPSLGSFFGQENLANLPSAEFNPPHTSESVSLAPNPVQLPTSEIEKTVASPPSVAFEQPQIQNFFESAPFDPFKQPQVDLALDNNTTNLNDNNANVENVEITSDIQNLSLDNENNIIEENSAQTLEPTEFPTIESTKFNPIAFFNNNPSEPIPADLTNEFQIQSFFNEPPPLTEVQENVQEKNFNFIRTNLLNKRIERIANEETASPETLSIASLIAEPASSAQSELSYIEPSTADVTPQSTGYPPQVLPESLQNNPDQADGINIFNWLDKQEATEMATTPVERTSTPTTSTATNIAYRPVYKHWFYKTTNESKNIWIPFSFSDSMLLEEAFVTNDREIVTTDGGRFDVNIPQRTRNAVYWTAESNEVRRCSWFYKGIDFRLIPYDEHVAEQLEEEYRDASHTGEWQRKIPLTTGETVMFSGPSDILHFLQSQPTDSWNNGVQNTEVRPRAVKRGTDEFTIDDGEPEQIDHLLFMVHGIGSACDLKFRKVEEVVDEFRSIALQLVQSHYRSSCDQGFVGRVEVLPISWHSELHSEESGIDEKLKAITLESIPKLRNFTNDTLLDILFYTSPVFCQQIIDAVSCNLNKCYTKFCERNPEFNGSVSVSGHSLGSVILFDLLQHQRIEVENSENLDTTNRIKSPLKRHCSQQINYTIGNAGTGQPYISYPQLSFQPKHFFALGSPIGMFVTIRGIDALGLDFKLPTTEHFFNIFHPYDPVAYRIEALVNPELQTMRPVLVPHHKGRKRMHLELRETVARVGFLCKQKIMQTLRSTIDTVYSYTTLPKGVGLNDTKAIQQEVDKVIDEQLTLDELETSTNASSASSEIYSGETDLALGKMNGGRRIDYVLQEAPLEIINEYLFALTSHVCYWGSEDATLFIIKEIYSSLNIPADTKIPQPTMTIERPSPSNSVKSSPTTS